MNYQSNDFYFSSDGDFVLSANRDLQDTSFDPFRSLYQDIESILKYNKGDWNNNIGANLDEFIGKPNTKETCNQIKLRVITELTKNSFIGINDINVDIYPSDKYLIVILIKINSNGKIVNFQHKFSLRDKPSGTKGKIE